MAGLLAWIAQSGVVQGVIIGATLAFLTTIVVLNATIRSLTMTVNGWRVLRACGRPGNPVLVRAACSKALPAVNVFEEAAYFTAARDAAGHALTGANEYVLHFPAGGLPPADAFWSLTVTDVVGYLVRTTDGRGSIDDRSALVANADGSIDVLLGHRAPVGRRGRNWLPVPAGRFTLMLRAYLPGAAILDGSYAPPPAGPVSEGAEAA